MSEEASPCPRGASSPLVPSALFLGVIVTVLEGLPILSGGKHFTPQKGACFMEYTSLLAGEEFTDHPRSVDSELCRVMIYLNDRAGLPWENATERSETRSLLTPLLGRSIGLVAPSPELADTLRRCANSKFRDQLHSRYSMRVTGSQPIEMVREALYVTSFGLQQPWSEGSGSRQWMTFAVELATILHECYEQAMTELGYTNRWAAVHGALPR